MPVKLKPLTLERQANRARHKATAQARRRKGGRNRWLGIPKKERQRIARENVAKIPRERLIENGRWLNAYLAAIAAGLPPPPTTRKSQSKPYRKRVMVEPEKPLPSPAELNAAAEKEMLRAARQQGTTALLSVPGKAPGQL